MGTSVEPRVASIEPLVTQLAYIRMAVNANTAGLTHEDSLVQPQPAGNCLNWVLGHLVASRNAIAELLGIEPVWDPEQAARYGRGSPPVTGPHESVRFEKLLGLFNTSHQLIVRGLQAMTEARLEARAPFSILEDPKETVGSLLAGFLFHESYMVGQTGLLRRIAGKEAALK